MVPAPVDAETLCKQADECLQEDQTPQALSLAEEAARVFAEAGDDRGVARAKRILILGKRNECEEISAKPVECDRLIEEGLAAARNSKNLYTEAIYLLVTTELNSDRRGSKKRAQALVSGHEALSLFRSIGDKEFEIITLLEIGNTFYKLKMADETRNCAREAYQVALQLKDRKSEALALHALGLSYLLGPKKEIDVAIAKAKEAAAIFHAIGARRLEASALRAIANWHIAEEKPKKAMSMAEESIRILHELPNAEVRESNSVCSLIDALLQKRAVKEALETATDARERFRASGNIDCEAAMCQCMANCLYASRRGDEASAVFEEGTRLMRQFPDKKMEFDYMVAAAKLYMEQQRFDEAHEKLREAQAVARQIQDSKKEVEALRNIASLTLITGDHETARTQCQEVLNQWRRVDGGASGEGIALALLAQATGSAPGRESEAIALATQSAELFASCKELRRECQVWSLISDLHQRNAKYSSSERGKVDAKHALFALEAAEKSLELRRQIGDKRQIGEGLMLLAALYLQSEDAQEAERLARDAQKIFQKIGQSSGEISAHLLLCQMYVAAYAEKPAGASEFLQKAMTAANEGLILAKKTGDLAARGWCSYWRAQVMTMCRHFEKALKTAQDAQHAFETASVESGVSHSLSLLADLYIVFGNDEKAKQSAEEALTIARACNDAAGEQLALDALQRIEKRRQEQLAKAPVKAQQQTVVATDDSQSALPAAAAAVSAAPVEKKGLDPAYAKEKLLSLVKDVIASDDEVDQDVPLMEAGMDSLSSVQLMTEVSKAFKLSLSPSLIFDFPTVRALTNHLVEETSAY